MPASKEPSTLVPFGPFEADLPSQELRKQGHRLRLPGQSFQILKMLLERPGELVTREELHAALWPSDTFVDFEHGLNAAINRLREALGDNADNPRYVETLPRRGYRFIGTIAQPDDAAIPLQVTVKVAEQRTVDSSPQSNQRKWWALGLGIVGLGALLVFGFHWRRSPSLSPRVLAYRQLTNDRQLKGQNPCGWASCLITDGPRVFFSESSSSVVEVSSDGGDAIPVSTPFGCLRIYDISPDKTELLGAAQAETFAGDQPLWVLSITSGLAHRLANLNGHSGGWSPDGQRIAFATGNTAENPNDLYVATKDGNDARKISGFQAGFIDSIRWSPDGKVLRMTVSGNLWEVAADGSNLHPVVLFSGENRRVTSINWTPAGKYFVFQALNADLRKSDVWAVRESHSILRQKSDKPFQLTFSPMAFANPVPSLDGKQIFAIGGQAQGELVRYDLKSGKPEPYLSGISADQLDFSSDGKWIAYVTYPEGTLWRSRVDGSDRMQLTNPPLRAALPHWSPDGTRIAFSGALPGGTWKICVVSAEGGRPQVVSQSESNELDATWFPDGDSLLFGRYLHSAQTRISVVDLRTARVSPIPDSDGKFTPRLSPDGRFIIATDAPGNHRVVLFDQRTQKWSELLSNRKPGTGLGWQVWSKDSKSVYVTDISDKHAPVFYRIRIADHNIERVAALEVPEGTTGQWNGWAGMTPDGSPLLLRDLSINEIYALDVDLP